jgi:hypothetical protein
MAVVMINEHGNICSTLPGIQNEKPIKALTTNGPNESLRDPVRLWCLNRRADGANAGSPKHLIEAAREFAVVIANQEANCRSQIVSTVKKSTAIRLFACA